MIALRDAEYRGKVIIRNGPYPQFQGNLGKKGMGKISRWLPRAWEVGGPSICTSWVCNGRVNLDSPLGRFQKLLFILVG